MKTRFDNILTPKGWVGLAGGLLAAGVTYAALIHPSLRLMAELDEGRAANVEAENEFDQVQAQFEQAHRDIAKAKKRLAECGGPPPHANQKDLQIARLTTLAQQCGITIDQYSPIDTVDSGHYRVFLIQFVGRGDFTAIQKYFARIESEIDFVDLTHFTISSVPTDSTPVCSVAWSCQINGMDTDFLPPEESDARTPARRAPTEAASNGS